MTMKAGMKTMRTEEKNGRIPDYIRRLEELEPAMTEDLCALVRRASVRGEPEEGAPFGRPVAEALETMLAMGAREGLRPENLDNMCGFLECGPEDASGLFGVLCHLDVVPAGDGWTNPPFEPLVTEETITGRGTLDDKGPTVAAFYALKSLLDCGYRPNRRIRMIFGLNEETGEESIAYYREHAEVPGFSIVPDADFPVVQGEKGIMVFDMVRPFGKVKKDGIRLVRAGGGSAPNMVPDRAEAVADAGERTEELMKRAVRFAEDTGYSLHAEILREEGGEDGFVRIRAEGAAAHGAMPWKGRSAVSILMAFLQTVEFNSMEVNEILEFYDEHVGFDCHGERLGIHFRDEVSGNLIFNGGVLRFNEEEFRLTVNIRVPVTMNDLQVYDGMAALTSRYSMKIERGMYQPPVYFQEDDERIVRLVKIYRKYSGDTETQPLIIGGGTYARQFPNAVAFGAMYPGDPDTMHAKNEYIRRDRLLQTAKIYAETLYEFAFEKKTDGGL